MKTIMRAFILLSILALFSCNLSTGGGTDDLTDVPASGATTVPTSADDAKSLYLEVSDVLYDKIVPSEESKGTESKALQEVPIDHDLGKVTFPGITMTGKIEGKIITDMPETMEAGSFSNSVDITVNMEGTMKDFVVTDSTDDKKSYTVSGTIKNTMRNKMSMKMDIAGESFAVTPSGTLELEISLVTNFAVKKSDGTGARFKLVFEDKSGVINLGTGNLGQPTGGQMPNGADAYDKKATLYTYDDTGKLVAEAEVPLKDTPWMMSNLMGGGGPSSGGTPQPGGPGGEPGSGSPGSIPTPPGQGSGPLTIQDSVADDTLFNSKEEAFLKAINDKRTSALQRVDSLDALARRYADVGNCDPPGPDLDNRIKTVFGNLTKAARFVFSTTSSDISVDKAMEAWLPNGGETIIKSEDYTQVGIAVLKPSNPNPAAAECVVVFLVDP